MKKRNQTFKKENLKERDSYQIILAHHRIVLVNIMKKKKMKHYLWP